MDDYFRQLFEKEFTESTPEDEEERLHIENIFTENPALAIIPKTVERPLPPGIGESFIHGLSLGLVGQEPETFGGTLAELGGELATYASLSALAGLGLELAGIRAGGSLLGKVAFEAGRESLGGAAASLITPEHDPYLPIVFGLLGGTGRFAVETLGKTTAATITPKLEEVFEPLIKPTNLEKIVDKIPKEAFAGILPEEKTVFKTDLEKSILKLSALADNLDELEGTIRRSGVIENELDKIIYNKYTKEELIKLGITEAKKKALELFSKLPRPLKQDELKIFLNSIEENPFVDKQALRTYANKVFLKIPRGEALRLKRTIDIGDVLEYAEKYNSYLAKMSNAIKVGLKPTSPINNIEHRVKIIEKELDRLEETFIKGNPQYRELLKEADNTLDDIYKNRLTGISPEFQKSYEYMNFLRTVARLLNKADFGLKAERALDTLSQVSKITNDVIKKARIDLKNVFQDVNKSVDNSIKDIISKVELGKTIDNKKIAKETRDTLLKYITDKLSEISPNYLPDELKQAREKLKTTIGTGLTTDEDAKLAKAVVDAKNAFITQAIEQPDVIERIAIDTGNPLLFKATLLYRHLAGDVTALDRLQAYLKTQDFHFIQDTSLRLFMDSEEGLARVFDSPLETITKPTTVVVKEKSNKLPPSELPPAEGGGGNLIEQLKTVGQEIKQDVGGIERLFRTPSLLFREKAEKAITPEYKELFNKVADFQEAIEKARLNIRKDYVGEFLPKVQELEALLRDPKISDVGIVVVDEVSKIANTMIKANVDENVIEQAIADFVGKQTSEVQSFYKKYRELTDWLLNYVNTNIIKYNEKIINKELRGEELPLIKRRPGYIPFIYEGDYFVYVLDNNKNVLWKDIVFINEFGEADSKLYKTILSILKRNPNLSGKIVVEPRFITDSNEFVSFGGVFKDIENIFGRDVKEIMKLLNEGKFKPNNVRDLFFGALEPRKASLEERRVETLRAITMHGISALRFANYLAPVRYGANLAQTAKVYNLPKLADYLTSYVDTLFGRAGKIEKILDDISHNILNVIFKVPYSRSVLNAFGIREHGRVVNKVVKGLTFLNRMVTLGFNIGTPIINTFLFLTNTVPVIGFKNAIFALRNTKQIFSKTSVYKELLDYAGLNLNLGGFGFYEIMTAPTVVAGKPRAFFKWLDATSLWLFNESEKVSRGLTLIGAYKQAERLAQTLAKGKSPQTWQEKLLTNIAERLGKSVNHKDTLFNYAMTINRKTQFIYDASDLGELLRATPLRPFTQFKTFFIKELEFLWGLGKDSKTDLLKSLGMLLALGGLNALPGINELDALSKTFFGFSPREWFYENLPEVVAAGLPASIGIDLSDRVNYGDITFLFSSSLGGVAGNKLKSAYNLAYNSGRIDLALRTLTPTSIRTLQDGYRILTGQPIRDPMVGDIVTLQPKEITNPLQLILRVIGFPTVTEAKFRQARQALQAIRDKTKRDTRKAIQDYIKAIEKGDFKEARGVATEYGLTERQIKDYMKNRSRSREAFLRDLVPKALEDEIEFND